MNQILATPRSEPETLDASDASTRFSAPNLSGKFAEQATSPTPDFILHRPLSSSGRAGSGRDAGWRRQGAQLPRGLTPRDRYTAGYDKLIFRFFFPQMY